MTPNSSLELNLNLNEEGKEGKAENIDNRLVRTKREYKSGAAKMSRRGRRITCDG